MEEDYDDDVEKQTGVRYDLHNKAKIVILRVSRDVHLSGSIIITVFGSFSLVVGAYYLIKLRPFHRDALDLALALVVYGSLCYVWTTLTAACIWAIKKDKVKQSGTAFFVLLNMIIVLLLLCTTAYGVYQTIRMYASISPDISSPNYCPDFEYFAAKVVFLMFALLPALWNCCRRSCCARELSSARSESSQDIADDI